MPSQVLLLRPPERERERGLEDTLLWLDTCTPSPSSSPHSYLVQNSRSLFRAPYVVRRGPPVVVLLTSVNYSRSLILFQQVIKTLTLFFWLPVLIHCCNTCQLRFPWLSWARDNSFPFPIANTVQILFNWMKVPFFAYRNTGQEV